MYASKIRPKALQTRVADKMSAPPLRRVLAAALAFTLAFALVPAPAASALSPAAVVESKEEVVYATLTGNGLVKAAYVVNHFVMESGGVLYDYGDYDSVQNLSTVEPVNQDLDTITAVVEEGDFYYQGDIAQAHLPWKVQIDYTLDGASVSPGDLGGASGLLGIHIATTRDAQVTDPAFYDNYLLQVQLTLDCAKARGIVAPDATIAAAGTDNTVAFTVLPGKDGDMLLTAQVTDFEMPAIQISALPFAMAFDLPDTDEMVDDMQQLTDAISELDDGVAELKDGTGDLVDASAKINDALALIADGLKNSSIDTSQVTQLATALAQSKTGLDTAIAAVDAQMPTAAEMAALQYALETANPSSPYYISGNDTAFGTVFSTYDSQSAITKLVTSYYVWNGTPAVPSPPTPAVPGVKDGLTQLSAGLGQINTGLIASLSQLAGLKTLTDGIATLSSNYATFHNGLSEYADGVGELKDGTRELYINTDDLPDRVKDEIDSFIADYDKSDFVPVSFVSPANTRVTLVQFVLTTEAIKAPEPEQQPEEAQAPTTLWDRIVALFTS